MVSFSKLLDLGLRNAKCQELYHPGKTCWQFKFQHTLLIMAALMKFYLPVAVIPLLTKGTSVRIREVLKYYGEACITGYFISQTFPFAFCGTRALLGRFSRFSIICIPITITTWPVLFTTSRIARLYATTMFQVVLEGILWNLKNPVCRTICQSNLLQTTLFMTCSAFIIHSVQKYGIKIIWLVKATPPSTKKHESHKCAHEGSCIRFCLKEFTKSLLFGLVPDFYRIFTITTSKKATFFSVLTKKLLQMDMPTALFLSLYTSIYKITSCLLTRTLYGDPQVKHMMAAFLGGISYYFFPRLTMLCYGTAISIQIAWNLFNRHKFEKEYKFVELLKGIPFHRFFIMVVAGALMHIYCFRLGRISKLGIEMVEGMTGNLSIIVRNDIENYLRNIAK